MSIPRSIRTGILAILLASVVFLGCSRDLDSERDPPGRALPSTCGEAQIKAIRLTNQFRYAEALEFDGYALKLCLDTPKILYLVLHRVADSGRLDHRLCPRARGLFEGIPPAKEIDYLRPALALQFFCGNKSLASPYLDELVELEAREISGSADSTLRLLVREYESARLFHWARNSEEQWHHLVLGTEELCSERMFSEAIRTLERWNKREDTPVGGLLGFWTSQPIDSIDENTKACLGRAAAEIEANLDRFPNENRWQLKEWLAWYRQNFGG